MVGLGVDARSAGPPPWVGGSVFDAGLKAPVWGSLLCRFPCRFGGGGPVDIDGEFDSGSGRTLAACLTHASRTVKPSLLGGSVANG